MISTNLRDIDANDSEILTRSNRLMIFVDFQYFVLGMKFD